MTIDYEGHRILTDKETIYLTPIQNEILNLLYENKNKVVKRKEIIEKIYNLASDKSLDTTFNKHMSLLNKKVKKYITIRNIKKVGYILETKINDNIKQKQEPQNVTTEIDNSITSDFTFDGSQDILPF